MSELVSSVMEQLALLHLLEDRLCAVVEAAQVGGRVRQAGMTCVTCGFIACIKGMPCKVYARCRAHGAASPQDANTARCVS